MRLPVLALSLCLAAPAPADLWARIPLDVRVDEADLIVTGKIVNEAPGPMGKGLGNQMMVSHTSFGFDGPPKITFGTLQVGEVLKGHPDGPLVRLAYGDRQNERELGDEGIWILQWDAEQQAYRCDYPWDRQKFAARAEIEGEIQSAPKRQYSGPPDGLQIYAAPRKSRLGNGENCAIAVGIHNAGPATVLDRKSYLQVKLDGQVLQTVKYPDWQPELKLQANADKRDFLGTAGEIEVWARSFPDSGPHSLSVELCYQGHQVASETMQVQRTSEPVAKAESEPYPDDPPVPVWQPSMDYDLHFTPDGQHLLTGDYYGVAGWSLETELPTFRLPQCKLMFNQAGALVAFDGFYDSVSGKLTRSVAMPQFVATGGNYGVVEHIFGPAEIWKLDPPSKLYELPAGDSGRYRVSPDGSRLTVLREKNRLSVFFPATGKLLKELPGVTSVEFDLKGRLLCGFADGTLQIDESPKWKAGPDEIRWFRSDRQGQRLVRVSRAGVVVWKASSHQPLLRLNPSRFLNGADFSPSGDKLAVIVNSEAQIYSVPDGKLLHHFHACIPGENLAWNETGSQLAVSGANAVTKWDFELGKPVWWAPSIESGPVLFTQRGLAWLDFARLHLVDKSRPVQATTLLVDGNSFVAGRQWTNQETLEPLPAKVPLETDERVLSMTQDFIAIAGNKYLRIIDRQGGKVGRFDQTSDKRYEREFAAISPDQRLLARLNDNHYIEVFELPSLRLKYSLGQSYFTEGLSWRKDSRQLAVAASNGVHLWNMQTGLLDRYLVCRLPASAAYSPDGRYLAEGLQVDASVCLWDLQKSEQVAWLASYGKEWVVLAPDGRFDASELAEPYLLDVDRGKRTPGLLRKLLAK
jgi:WD40 repeat protein